MRLALAALAGLAAASTPEVRAVRVTSLDLRTAVRLLGSDDMPPAEVVREGDAVVLRVPAPAPAELRLPALEKPLEALTIEREPGRTVVRIRVAAEVPFEASQEPGMLTVVFGEQPAPELRGPVSEELYARLFPTTAVVAAPVETEPAPGPGEPVEGIALGAVALRPYLSASWVDADVAAFDSPTPVPTRYLQLAPGLTASTPLLGGQLSADYEPRLRFFSDIAAVNDTSHLAGLRLELPLGSRVRLRVSDRFTHATLETGVVDAGREYFFNLAPYDFNELVGFANVDLGPRLFAEAEAGWGRTRFGAAAGQGFFDYDSRTARAGLGYDLGGDLRAVVSYSIQRIPPSPDRALVQTSAHQVGLTLTGPLGPLMTGSLSAGYRSQRNPLASAASASYKGLTLGGTLRRELGHSTSVDLQLNRAAMPSAFEANAYYVTNSAGVSLTLAGPYQTSLRGSLSALRNDYPNAVAGLGAPRRDDILGWAIGIGRQLGWRAFVRADYRRERRNSNLPGYDVTTSGFVVQLGVGLFGPGRTGS